MSLGKRHGLKTEGAGLRETVYLVCLGVDGSPPCESERKALVDQMRAL
jgi:hypothetical protein